MSVIDIFVNRTCSILATSSDSMRLLGLPADGGGTGMACRHGGGVADLTCEAILSSESTFNNTCIHISQYCFNTLV